MKQLFKTRFGATALAGAVITGTALFGLAFVAWGQEPFRGGIQESRDAAAAKPIPVRNDVAQPGDEIVTLRHFRIKKGTFDQFYEASTTGVWPYFEKMGSRVIGMWKEIHPDTGIGAAGTESAEYDDVYLMTRYASVEHWRATRDLAAHGGNGPDWAKCREALALRQSITLESSVKFLDGGPWDNRPWFMPGLPETYEPVGNTQ